MDEIENRDEVEGKQRDHMKAYTHNEVNTSCPIVLSSGSLTTPNNGIRF